MSRAKDMFSVSVPNLKNKEDFPAYKRPLKERYLQTLLTNTISNTYYANKYELLMDADRIHDEMLKEDPYFVAKALPYARQYGYMRLQPIFGLAKLSAVNTDLFKQTFPKVILIPSDLQDFMTIIEGMGRGQGGRAIKTTITKWLNENLSEYWAIKYNGKGRSYSLTDIVKTIHPRPNSLKTDLLYKYLVGKITKDELDALPQVKAYEELKRTSCPKRQVELAKDGKLPHEVVTGVTKMTPELWDSLVPDMPVFALLRHLNTLDRYDVLDSNREIITSKLNNPDVLANSKILPFRFVNAFYNVEKPWVKDVLRQSVELTFQNLSDIPGKTAVLLDISGSMSGKNLQIGSVFALALYKKTDGNSILKLFNTRTYDPEPSMYDSILTQAEKIQAKGGTDTGSPVREMLERKERVDNIIMITDEQQNSGRPLYQELKRYKQSINPDVKTFIVDISPYQSAMIPELDQNTWYIYGWSEQVLQFISQSIRGYDDIVRDIESR